MKVAILTMFNGLSSTYSLVNVVAEQLKMLLKDDIYTKVLVSENCPDSERKGIYADQRIEWVKIINNLNGKQIHWRDYSQTTGSVHDTFYDEVEVISLDLVQKLADVDFCIMHDIHYQGWHLVHNVALRKAQKKLPNLKFIAFTHSLPVNPAPEAKWPFSARYTPMPNTIYVYPTQSGISALARQYNVSEKQCKVVNNSLNLIENMSKEIKLISNNIDLLSPEILIIYPGRLTSGKKFENVAALAGVIKTETNSSIKVIFCDFQSMDISPQKYKKIIINKGYDYGLEEGDLFFTSDFGFPFGIPRESVMELFTLSNLFINPSYSESFGLTVLEAASRGNFLVLNKAVPALKELGKNFDVYFMRWNAKNFGYDTLENYIPSEKAYYQKHGKKIYELMKSNEVIQAKTKVRRFYNPDWIWKNQFKPLLQK